MRETEKDFAFIPVRVRKSEKKQLQELCKERKEEFRNPNFLLNAFIQWILKNPDKWEYRGLELKENNEG